MTAVRTTSYANAAQGRLVERLETHAEHNLLSNLTMTTTPAKKRTMEEIKTMGQLLKGMVEELRVQVHLGAMDLKDDAGPYLNEVATASRAATKELLKRGKELKTHLAKLQKNHKPRS